MKFKKKLLKDVIKTVNLNFKIYAPIALKYKENNISVTSSINSEHKALRLWVPSGEFITESTHKPMSVAIKRHAYTFHNI